MASHDSGSRMMTLRPVLFIGPLFLFNAVGEGCLLSDHMFKRFLFSGNRCLHIFLIKERFEARRLSNNMFILTSNSLESFCRNKKLIHVARRNVESSKWLLYLLFMSFSKSRGATSSIGSTHEMACIHELMLIARIIQSQSSVCDLTSLLPK